MNVHGSTNMTAENTLGVLRVQDAQDDSMDAGGTIPGKESIESSLEQRPRATPGQPQGCDW